MNHFFSKNVLSFFFFFFCEYHTSYDLCKISKVENAVFYEHNTIFSLQNLRLGHYESVGWHHSIVTHAALKYKKIDNKDKQKII